MELTTRTEGCFYVASNPGEKLPCWHGILGHYNVSWDRTIQIPKKNDSGITGYVEIKDVFSGDQKIKESI